MAGTPYFHALSSSASETARLLNYSSTVLVNLADKLSEGGQGLNARGVSTDDEDDIDELPLVMHDRR